MHSYITKAVMLLVDTLLQFNNIFSLSCPSLHDVGAVSTWGDCEKRFSSVMRKRRTQIHPIGL